MSKALVIRGASYSENALDTVTFDVIHCTGITLSDSTVSLSAIGATKALTATVVPSNCEEEVEWTSSNTACCTVSSEGLVTVVGVGTSTITANCGTQTATCAVTVEVVLTDYGKYCNSVNYPNSTSNDITTLVSYKTNHSYYDYTMLGVAVDPTETKLLVDYNMATSTHADATIKPVGERPNSYREIGWCIPIALPPNCSKVRVNSLDSTFGAFVLFFKKDVPSQYCGGYMASRALTTWSGSSSSGWPFVYGSSTEFTIPTGYDSITVCWRLNTEESPFSAFRNATEEQLAAFTITAC